jgi:hypothetical protein
LSYNEIGDNGAISVARLFEEHDEMQSRLELWGQAKRKRIEISEQLTNYTEQVREFTIASSRLRCYFVDQASHACHAGFLLTRVSS